MNSGWRQNYVRYRGLFLNFVNEYKKKDDLKVYLELFLSLATVSIFAVFALRPTLLTISTLIKEIDAKEKTIIEMDNKIEMIIDAQQAYDRNRPQIIMLKEAVPEKADPDVILRQIEGAVNENKVQVSGLEVGEMTIIYPENPNQNEDQDTDLEIPVSISTTADYLQLLSMVTTVEQIRKPFKINQVNFHYTSEDKETAELTLTLEAGLPLLKIEAK